MLAGKESHVSAAGASETITQTLSLIPVLPDIDANMKLRLQSLLVAGQARGNRLQVFAKVGDSITAFSQFMKPIGCGQETLDTHTELSPTITYFRSTTMPADYGTGSCGVVNSFNRTSVASAGGWSAVDVLRAADSPRCGTGENYLTCELRLTKPASALIMFGTNDIPWKDPLSFHAYLSQVVAETIAAGVIPILSTVPQRLDTPENAAFVTTYNAQIVMIAAGYQVPLVNYWRAMQDPLLVNLGLNPDHIHPNTYMLTDSANFTPEGLNYGFNVRNLVELGALAKFKSIVIEDGPPDVDPVPLFTATPSPTHTPRPTRTPRPRPTSTRAPTHTPPATATATATAVPSGCAADPFMDVCPGDYFYAPVRDLVARQIVSGYTSSPPCDSAQSVPCFKPYNTITRAQLAKLVSSAAGYTDEAGVQMFVDVPPGSTFYVWVQRLASRGIVGGYQCGTPEMPCDPEHPERGYFLPDNNASRGQISKIVSSAKGYDEPHTDQIFEDVLPESTFYIWIERLASRGTMSGYTCGGPTEPCITGKPYFRPGSMATRGQVSKIVDGAFFP